MIEKIFYRKNYLSISVNKNRLLSIEYWKINC